MHTFISYQNIVLIKHMLCKPLIIPRYLLFLFGKYYKKKIYRVENTKFVYILIEYSVAGKRIERIKSTYHFDIVFQYTNIDIEFQLY